MYQAPSAFQAARRLASSLDCLKGVIWESVYTPPSNSIWAEARSLEYSVQSAFSFCSSGTISGEKVRMSISLLRKTMGLYFSASWGLQRVETRLRFQRSTYSCSSGRAVSAYSTSAS